MTGRAPARRTEQDRQRRAELISAAAGMTLSVYRLDPGTGARHTVVAEYRVEGPPPGRHCLAEPSVYPPCQCGRTPDCRPGQGSVGAPIEVALLSAGQVAGMACARCRYPLYGSVPIEGYRDIVTGAPLDLWSCLECATDAEIHGPVHWYSRYVCVLCLKVAPRAVIIGRRDGSTGPGYTEYAHLACARDAGREILAQGRRAAGAAQ